MEPGFLSYKNSQIAWYRFGTGKQIVFCFHGYGENATNFSFLEKHAGDRFSFIAIDLPFHGKTEWRDGLDFSWEDLRNIINAINNKHQTINEKLILLGFSLGGRIALSLYQAVPDKIEKLVLLAPDGLKMNFWYWVSTQTWLGKKLFYFTMQHPGWFFGFLKVIRKIGIVNSSIFKFVKYYIDNADVRHELYNRWITLRKLRPNLSKIKSLIRSNKTPVRLVYGMHDKIILSVRGEKFKKGIEEHCTISVIESGHQVLHEKHVKDILKQLEN